MAYFNQTKVSALSPVITKIICVLLVGCFFSLLYGALNHRPLFSDGAMWNASFLAWSNFQRDTSLLRYSDLFMQLPGWLWLHLGGRPLSAVRINELVYSLHPFLSLLLSAWLLQRRRRLDLLVFPLMSFAAVTQTVIAVPYSLVPDILSLSWPFVILSTSSNLAANPKLRWLNALTLALLLLTLVLSHEAVVYLLATLTILELHKGRTQTHRFKWLPAVGYFALTLWLIYRIYTANRNVSIPFAQGLLDSWNAFEIFAVATTTIFAVAALPFRNRLPARLITSVLTTVCSVIFLLLHPPGSEDQVLWSVFAARFLAVPLHCLFVILYYSNLNSAIRWTANEVVWRKLTFAILLMLTLAVSLWNDINLNRDWNKTVTYVRERSAGAPGCKLMTDLDELARNSGSYDRRTFQILSSIISTEAQGQMGVILFHPGFRKKAPPFAQANPCCLLRKGLFSIFRDTPKIETNWNLDFTQVILATQSDTALQQSCAVTP